MKTIPLFRTFLFSLVAASARCAAAFTVCAVGDSITEGGSAFVAHRVALEGKFAELGWNNDAIGALGVELNTPASPVIVVDMAEGWNPATDCVGDKVHPSAAGAEKMATKRMAALQGLVAAGKLSVETTAPYERLFYVATPENNNVAVDTGYVPLLTDRIETRIRIGTIVENRSDLNSAVSHGAKSSKYLYCQWSRFAL